MSDLCHIYYLAGLWEQWDTIVYPKGIPTEHGVKIAQDESGPGMAEYVLSQLYLSYDDPENTNPQITDNPEDQERVVERCLIIYLRSYKSKLQSCDVFSTTFAISQMVNDVRKIFDQLQNRLIGHISESGNRIYYSKKNWSSKRLFSVRFQYQLAFLCIHACIFSLRSWSVGQ